jgi:hypothetical protein
MQPRYYRYTTPLGYTDYFCIRGGALHGTCIIRDPQGRLYIYETFGEGGLTEGPRYKFHEGRLTLAATYRAGLAHGPYAEYGPETGAPLISTTYRDGYIYGEFKWYYPRGGPLHLVGAKDGAGNLVGRLTVYNTDGTIFLTTDDATSSILPEKEQLRAPGCGRTVDFGRAAAGAIVEISEAEWASAVAAAGAVIAALPCNTQCAAAATGYDK